MTRSARSDETETGTETETETETETCRRGDCTKPAKWSWWNGMGAIGRYCDTHAREDLDPEARLPAYSDPVTTESDLRGRRVVVIPGGGVKPLGERTPVLRSKEAFDAYLEGEDAFRSYRHSSDRG